MPAAPQEVMRYFDRRFRLIGWQGLVGMAVSGIDMALWDALGQAAGLPVVRLLGGTARPLNAYDSYGVVDPDDDADVMAASVASGFKAIKIKGGDGDISRDVATVRRVREIIGPDVRLMVDFNQALDVPEAIRRIRRLTSLTCIGSRSRSRQKILLAMRGFAPLREQRYRPARTGGFPPAWRRRFRPALRTTRCPI